MTLPQRHLATPGATVALGEIDPADSSARPEGKSAGRREMDKLRVRLADLQHMLWASGSHSLLVVFQAMDAGGKDGTIRTVLGGVNPHGVDIADFKAPSPRERSHDFLWRIHERTPGKGRIAVFNRSHYEDVLVARVMGLVPEDRWRRRFRHIADFEQMLVDEGTTILKFFLHISPEEQAERLQKRLDDPAKRWKFDPADLEARHRWHDYMAAYEDVISRTSTSDAPWYIVPADRKWYRNLVVGSTLLDALEGLDLRFPDPAPGLESVIIEPPPSPSF